MKIKIRFEMLLMQLMRFYINSTIISNENCRKLLFMDTDFIQAIKMCSLQRQMIERVSHLCVLNYIFISIAHS